MEWLNANLAPMMFGAVALLLLSGIPVAFALAAAGLGFSLIGIELGILPPTLMQALPLRLFGIMANETLLAIPFFTFMGLLLERSGMAEDLLETVGQVFGGMRGGIALAVVLVGALLAATTGVVAASVISMGLISLPVMLRNGYNRSLACGVITASGSLAQVVPPSLVLIVMADQLGRSVGDMYAGALMPALLLISLYVLLVLGVALVKPGWAPALHIDSRIALQADGSSGRRSLAVLAGLGLIASQVFLAIYPQVTAWAGRVAPAPKDEVVIVGLAACVLTGFVIALVDAVQARWSGRAFLSPLARRVAFVLVPPLILIFLVLGSIFLGVATPTEGGAMGATGALILAAARKRLTLTLTLEALLRTTKLATFIMFILIGSTVFSLVFQGLDGQVWVEHLFDKLPGGALGFLIFVSLLIFLLGFFLDFFEIAFILLPLLAPVAEKLGIDLIWFGVLVGINLQTSFLTPPFGFALFYLRSVAPAFDPSAPAGSAEANGVRTSDIYKGAIPFVGLQVLVMALVIAFPQLVIDDPALRPKFNRKAVTEQLLQMSDDDAAARASDRGDFDPMDAFKPAPKPRP